MIRPTEFPHRITFEWILFGHGERKNTINALKHYLANFKYNLCMMPNTNQSPHLSACLVKAQNIKYSF